MTTSPVIRRTAPRLVAGLVALVALLSACMPADDPTPGATSTDPFDAESVTVEPSDGSTGVVLQPSVWPSAQRISDQDFADGGMRPRWDEVSWENLLIPAGSPVVLTREDEPENGGPPVTNTYELGDDLDGDGFVRPYDQLDGAPADGMVYDWRDSNTEELPFDLYLYSTEDPGSPVAIIRFDERDDLYS